MRYSNSDSAQGTIEYLVILAIVVVIGLVVVGLVVGVTISPSQEILDSSKKLGGSANSGISVVESVVDLDGDSLVELVNNSGDFIYLSKITLCDGVVNDYGEVGEQIVGGDSKLFSLSSSACSVGEKGKSCEIKIEYTTRDGLSKSDSREVTVTCVGNSIPNTGGGGRDPVNPIPIELGTLEHPWIINDCLELQDMNKHLDGNYILGNDVNCYNDTREGGALYNGGAGFTPIGEGIISFTGNLNGNNHTVSNLLINLPSTDFVGLFSYFSGSISNIGLVDVSITNNGVVGGLVGNMNSGSIINSYSTGSVLSYGAYNGGLVGYAYHFSTISNCYSTVNVSAERYYVGGLVGRLDSHSTISNSYSTGSVTGLGDYVGGLVGSMGSGSITDSYSTGSVYGSGSSTGGLVGYASGPYADGPLTISNSYSTGTVIGNDMSGGLVGQLGEEGTISNSYSTGDVSGSSNVGGLVGYSQCSITNSYSTGFVSGSENVGGLVGFSNYGSTISNSYWDVNTSGVGVSGENNFGAIGKTTAEMKSRLTYDGWDFVNTWEINEGVSYPILFWQ